MACHSNHHGQYACMHAYRKTHLHRMEVYNTRRVCLIIEVFLIKILLFSTTEIFTSSKVISTFKR